MSRKPKPPPDEGEKHKRTTVSMPRKFWEEEVEKQMIGEGFDNFSSYISFLLKLRRENLHQRRIEVARLEGKPIGESAAAALNEKEQPDPKRKAV